MPPARLAKYVAHVGSTSHARIAPELSVSGPLLAVDASKSADPHSECRLPRVGIDEPQLLDRNVEEHARLREALDAVEDVAPRHDRTARVPGQQRLPFPVLLGLKRRRRN